MYDILVVGNGISAFSFIDGLKIHKKKVAIISLNQKHNIKKKLINKLEKIDIDKKNLPPRFNLSENIYPLIQYFIKNKINIQKDISFFGYLNTGGVSNYWGCSCEFPPKSKINFLNNRNKKNLIESFDHIYKKYNFSGKYNIDSKNIYFKDRKINNYFQEIINKTRNIKRSVNFYLNCIAVDSIKKTPFIPKYIKNNKKITELNYFVEKIKKKKSTYEVFCEDINGKKCILTTKKVILAAGTIATTRIVCQMTRYRKKVTIQHNPMLFGVFLTKKNLNISQNFIPSTLAARINLSNSNYSAIANFRASNNSIKNKIFESFFFMKNFFSKKLFSLIEKKLFFVNLYLDNKFSNLQMNVSKNGETKISLKRNDYPLIKKELSKYFIKIFTGLREYNHIYPFKYSYLPNIGSDNHFTGTIPISKNKTTLALNENCELNNHKNFYVIDGSAIPKTNLKFPTGMIIANAYRVGKLL